MSSSTEKQDPALAEAFAKVGLPVARHHLFFCVGPDCCTTDQGLTTWEHAKLRLRELDIKAMRTKAACFRLCQRGPWLLIYPEGIWYDQVTPERFDRIAKEHLLNGQPIKEWIQAVHPLPQQPEAR